MLQRVMSQFSVESFSSHITKHFVEEPFCAVFQKISDGEQSLWKRRGRGEYRYFPSNFFCLKVPKSFVVEPFSLSLVSGIEKSYASEGYATSFRRKFFV